MKNIFRKYRVKKNNNSGEEIFNFLKFYAIFYYIEFIRRYKYIDGVNILILEAYYKYLIKSFYKIINIKKNYL